MYSEQFAARSGSLIKILWCDDGQGKYNDDEYSKFTVETFLVFCRKMGSKITIFSNILDFLCVNKSCIA